MAGDYAEYGDNIRIQNFGREFIIELQQEMSDLMPYVMIDRDFPGEVKYIPKIGKATGFKKRQQRNETIDGDPVTTNRRKMEKDSYYAAQVWDKLDELYGSLAVENPIMQQLKNNYYVEVDQIIIEAALGTAYEGKNGSDAVAFPAANILDSSATTGATFAKLLELRTKASTNYVKGEIYWFVTPVQMEELLEISQLTNFDLNSQRNLEQGRVLKWWNVTIIETNSINLDSGEAYYETIAMTKNSVVYGMTQDITMGIHDNKPQNFGYSLIAEFTGGATRVRDEGVFEIRCKVPA